MSRISSHPLAGYENLIEHNGIGKALESFLNDAEHLGTSLDDLSKTTYRIYENNNDGEVTITTVHFSDELDKRCKKVYDREKKVINSYLANSTDEQQRDIAIRDLLDKLDFLGSQTALIHEQEQQQIIRSWLIRMIRYIKDKYPSYQINHQVYSKLESRGEFIDTEDEFFGFKGSENDLKSLYRLLVQLDVITSETTSERDFIDTLSAIKPEEASTFIQFECTTLIASYVLGKMSKFFDTLKDEKIIQSNLFKNKQGKYLTNLTTPRSKFRNRLDLEEKRNKIDNAFENFKIKKR